jgi:uncharacterized protein YbaR (Trm112 family)
VTVSWITTLGSPACRQFLTAPAAAGGEEPQLLAAACPFSHLVEDNGPVVLVYNHRSTEEDNIAASRLTTELGDGLSVKIKGPALVLRASPGEDFTLADWRQYDNAIYDEIMEFFGQGVKPSADALSRLAKDFKTGKFIYDKVGSEDEDENKDDGGLEGWG